MPRQRLKRREKAYTFDVHRPIAGDLVIALSLPQYIHVGEKIMAVVKLQSIRAIRFPNQRVGTSRRILRIGFRRLRRMR
jgi:hypothetical protein